MEVEIFYIGPKKVRTDSVMRNRIRVWRGYGSSQMIPEADVAGYLAHPTVWSKSVGKGPAVIEQNVEEMQEPDPDADPTREEQIKAAILSLDPENPNDYSTGGRPRVARISQILGYSVGGDEIDVALRAVRSEAP